MAWVHHYTVHHHHVIITGTQTCHPQSGGIREVWNGAIFGTMVPISSWCNVA